jgi:hypothetical protein
MTGVSARARHFLFTVDADWVPGSDRGLDALLALCEEKQLRATIFTTGRFSAAYRALIAQAHAAGHEIGVHGWEHPMPTFGAENYRFTPIAQRRDWLVRATDTVAGVIGQTPRSFRAPYLWTDAATFGLLERLGYAIDSSVPTRRFDGLVGMVNHTDFLCAPLDPYHPDPQRPGRRGASPILEVPPSAFLLPLNMSTVRFAGLRWALRLVGIIARRATTLNFYCHPWEFVEREYLEFPTGTPQRHTRGLGPGWLAVLRAFLDATLERGYVSSTTAEVAACGSW